MLVMKKTLLPAVVTPFVVTSNCQILSWSRKNISRGFRLLSEVMVGVGKNPGMETHASCNNGSRHFGLIPYFSSRTGNPQLKRWSYDMSHFGVKALHAMKTFLKLNTHPEFQLETFNAKMIFM